MYTLILDTETTGLPEKNVLTRKFFSPENVDKYNGSRLVEFAYTIIDEDTHEVVVSYCSCTKFEGMDIKNSHIHGITTEIAMANGVDVADSLDEFERDINAWNVGRVVAHNIEFDICILLSECHRYAKKSLIDTLIGLDQFCTMKQGMVKMNTQKYPKLIDLFHFFFGVDNNFKQHSAMNDCIACQKCYIKMIYKL
jgi:DNA polymerase III epsilon subunit-like protein